MSKQRILRLAAVTLVLACGCEYAGFVYRAVKSPLGSIYILDVNTSKRQRVDVPGADINTSCALTDTSGTFRVLVLNNTGLRFHTYTTDGDLIGTEDVPGFSESDINDEVHEYFNYYKLSPDGKKFFYTTHIEVYLHDIPSGTTLQINNLIGHDVHMIRWLNNDEVLVMTSDAFAVVRTGNATATKLSECGSVLDTAISPDKKQLAYVELKKSNPRQLCLLEIDTGEVKTIVPNEKNQDIGTPAWTPDGKQIAYVCGNNLTVINPADNSITSLCALDDGSKVSSLAFGDEETLILSVFDWNTVTSTIYGLRISDSKPELKSLFRENILCTLMPVPGTGKVLCE